MIHGNRTRLRIEYVDNIMMIFLNIETKPLCLNIDLKKVMCSQSSDIIKENDFCQLVREVNLSLLLKIII